MTAARTLLTIEEEEPIRKDIRAFFETLGFTVMDGKDGHEGLSIFKEKRPAVALVNLHMKKMSGLDVVDRLSREAPEIPVVAFSETGLVADAIHAIRKGAWDCVIEPVQDMAELEHVVRSVLERPSLREESKRPYKHLKAEHLLRAKARELEILNRLGREMSENPFIDPISEALLAVTMQAIEPDLAILFLRNGKKLHLKGLRPEEHGFTDKNLPAHRVGECLCGMAVEGGETLYSLNIHADCRCTFDECKDAGFCSFAALPLKSEGEVIGVLGMAATDERDFEKEASFLEPLGNEAAIGLNNALLIQKVQADAIELQTRLVQIHEAQKEKEELILQLTHAQKMEAIGTLAAGIAHDFNNILTPIMMGTEFVLMNLSGEDENRRMLNRILDAVARAKDLVDQILTFSRRDDLEKSPVNLAPILEETVKLARAALPSTIEIRENIAKENDVIMANPTQIHQLIMNLITNAAHAMRDKGGTLEISLKPKTLDDMAAAHMKPPVAPGAFLKLTVKDSGHGMNPDIMAKIFDPYFTTKERGEGTGMGLSTVHGIVGACKGAVQVESELGKGSLFTVYLPELPSTAKKTLRQPKVIPRGTERILFVDDEPMIANTYADMLGPLGYRVDCRTDPLDTLEAFRNNPFEYDLVITDMTMPKMTGEKLGIEIMRIRPEIPVLLCSGYSAGMSEQKARELGFSNFVMKPAAIQEIAEKIRAALDINMTKR